MLQITAKWNFLFCHWVLKYVDKRNTLKIHFLESKLDPAEIPLNSFIQQKKYLKSNTYNISKDLCLPLCLRALTAKSWFKTWSQVCRVAEPPSQAWSGQGAPRSRSSVVRSYSTGQQEPRPYSPPLLPNNPNSLLNSLHQGGSSLMGLEEDNSVEEEEDNLGNRQQDRMDIEVSPPSPSPPTSRWS